MPTLTPEQKAIIHARLRDRVPVRDIAAEARVSKSTVISCKQKIEEYGEIKRKPGSGRRKITTEDENTELVNFLREHPFKTAINAKEETNFPGSSRTARRRIRESDINNRCAANKIFLTEENKQRRVEFCRQYLNENNLWERVIFSDEKSFQSCNNGKIRVYRPVNTRYDERYTHKTNQSGRFSINVWGWISARGPGVLQIVQGRLTAAVYRDILHRVMIPSVGVVYGENYIFQHDNAPIHKARIVQEFIREHNVHVLPWSSRSPDLNPIENIWGEMTKYMYRHDFRPRSQEELRQKIFEAWDEITPELTRHLVLSMPRRVQAVIDSNGAMTKY